jgi:hypothetical protein
MNLKHIKSTFVFLTLLAALACASKKEEAAKTETAEQKDWSEMDDFHMVMADAFHPFKDSANLAPAKAKAGELATSAETWANAPVPEKVNNDDMKSKLAELKKQAATFVQTVASADDKAIGDQLTQLHDLFHSIQEDWYGAGKGGESEHEHH